MKSRDEEKSNKFLIAANAWLGAARGHAGKVMKQQSSAKAKAAPARRKKRRRRS